MVRDVSFPYTILHKGLNLHITALNIDDLHLHEEVLPDLVNKLVQSIRQEGYVKDPIIVDKGSLVVLDGTHRMAALKKIGCKWVPACLVDCENPAITVGCWYRTIKGDRTIGGILREITQMGFDVKEVGEIDKPNIGVSPVVAAVKTWKKFFLVRSPFESLMDAFNFIKQIEERLKLSALNVEYEMELDALCKLQERGVDVVLLTPKVKKDCIVETALSGRVFPYKATRHIVPARPLHINVPLNLLEGDERSLFEINKELKRMLQKRQLKHVVAGSFINGRRYEEDLYLFEG